jgi:O-antigen ligase
MGAISSGELYPCAKREPTLKSAKEAMMAEDVVFPRKYGWLTMWLVLVIVGVISPFGAAPSSIEGVLYTVLPGWFHVAGFPEVFVQAGVLSFLTYYWVNHPEKKWLDWILGILLAIVVVMSLLGTLSAAGVLPAAR